MLWGLRSASQQLELGLLWPLYTACACANMCAVQVIQVDGQWVSCEGKRVLIVKGKTGVCVDRAPMVGSAQAWKKYFPGMLPPIYRLVDGTYVQLAPHDKKMEFKGKTFKVAWHGMAWRAM